MIWEQGGSRSWIPLNDFVDEELWQEYDRKHPRGEMRNKVGLISLEFHGLLCYLFNLKLHCPIRIQRNASPPNHVAMEPQRENLRMMKKAFPLWVLPDWNAIDYSIFVYIHLFISHVTAQRGKASMFVSIYFYFCFCFALTSIKQLTILVLSSTPADLLGEYLVSAVPFCAKDVLTPCSCRLAWSQAGARESVHPIQMIQTNQ